MVERPLVAIVDDDESIRRATHSLLRAAGFATAAFSDAESFLSSATRASTACLVADMRMPGMSGLELYHALVASGEGVPTVLITAYPEDITRSRAREAGISCLLGKPFAAEELLECIHAALARPRPGSAIPKS
jgi:FixJ family two-component response regulator